jgi:hypothetical protein
MTTNKLLELIDDQLQLQTVQITDTTPTVIMSYEQIQRLLVEDSKFAMTIEKVQRVSYKA